MNWPGFHYVILSPMQVVHAPVLAVEKYPADNVLILAEAPEIADACRPGQFVMADVDEGMEIPSPLLKRALAVYSLGDGQASGRVGLLIKVVGEGSRRLASVQAGEYLNLIGPLGNGFSWKSGTGRQHLIIAGGIGIASVLLLAQRLKAKGENVHLIYGAASRSFLVGLEDFQDLGIPIVITTEDGSAGIKGLITEGLQQHLEVLPAAERTLYTCGPTPMMEAVAAIASAQGLPCQISVEVKMACGFGVCLGCSVKTVDSYRLACTHGPVFEADGFVWEPKPVAAGSDMHL